MSRTDILNEIKKAEADANALVVKAEEDKKSAIAEARRDSVKKIQDAEVQMRSSYESAIASEKEALNSKRDAMIAEGSMKLIHSTPETFFAKMDPAIVHDKS